MLIPLSDIHAELWRRFGDIQYPAEWDGNTFGGSRLSQRFWEYHAMARLLELEPESAVLDIGGYSQHAGGCFFADLLSKFVQSVIVVDPSASERTPATPANIEIVREPADHDTISRLLTTRRVSHISCISVFEHIAHDVRQGIIAAIQEHFVGFVFASTLEYDSFYSYFEQQLTSTTIGATFSGLTSMYPDVIESCPMHCENASALTETVKPSFGILNCHVPLWKPLAVRFVGQAYNNRKKVFRNLGVYS